MKGDLTGEKGGEVDLMKVESGQREIRKAVTGGLRRENKNERGRWWGRKGVKGDYRGEKGDEGEHKS